MRSERCRALRAAGIEVSLRGVDLHRGDRHVLRDLDWRLRPGQRWVLAGANGSGKTQLLKLVAGAVWPDPRASGTQRSVAPRRYRFTGPAAGDTGEWSEQPLGIAEQIAYLGPERQERYERYGWNFTVRTVVATGLTHTDIPERPLTRAERARVSALLREFGLERLAQRCFLTLSYGQRRIVLFVRALAGAPRLLLLDEPFGGLDAQHVARLQRWFAGPGARAAWVLATHRPEEAPPSARRVLVALERVSVFIDWSAALHDIDLEIAAGQCWVVHGANGAGKTTLLRAIWGDWPAARGGRIWRRGIGPGVPLERFQRRCGLVAPHQHSEQPPSSSVLEVVISGLRGSVGLAEPARAGERHRARRALAALGLADRAAEAFALLSWGTARRVLLARATVHRPRLLLLDEPCSGLAPTQRLQLRTDVDALLARGLTVVMTTHHRDEWPRRTTHEIELHEGRALYVGPRRY